MEAVMVFAGIGIVYIGIPVALFLFGRAVLRALNRRTVAESQVAEINERLRKLEERVEEVGSDNIKLSEANRFATALLAQKQEGSPVRG